VLLFIPPLFFDPINDLSFVSVIPLSIPYITHKGIVSVLYPFWLKECQEFSCLPFKGFPLSYFYFAKLIRESVKRRKTKEREEKSREQTSIGENKQVIITL